MKILVLILAIIGMSACFLGTNKPLDGIIRIKRGIVYNGCEL